jgi:murein DD-endopeptidase MepM/ murein hydrolase activator NlpD
MAPPIHSFPVRYPNPWRPSRRAAALPNDRWSLEIRFRDSFHDPRGSGQHHAIDILGDEGLIVASSTDGTVAESFIDIDGIEHPGACYTTAAGNIVVIIDPAGYMHYYAHLREAAMVSAGQHVLAGQQIGWLGRTGTLAAGGPLHLHYQVSEPLRDASRHNTSGFSTRDNGRIRYNQFPELRGQAQHGPWLLDHRGRIVIPPKDQLPTAPRRRR